jgi:signal transduction histidine kinase
MRLLTKTTLYLLLAMMLLLVAGGYFFYRHFSMQINQRADKELIYEEVQWVRYLRAATGNGTNFILRSPDLLIFPTEKEPTRYPSLTNMSGPKADAAINVPYRQLAHVVSIHGVPYQIVIRKSQEQKLALVSNITWILLMVFSGLFIATILFNWIINKRIWKPFQRSLQQVRNLELRKTEVIHFEPSNIQEFNELNSSLQTMVQKIQSDYINMKEFTENAAHEMQTPLAVAQSKMELLLQDPQLSDSQIGTVAQAIEALSRLSKMNQSLLLLAKIENNQFEATEAISLVTITQKYLHLFDEMIKDKDLVVDTTAEADFMVSLHPFLADSLISNLLGNAIKYNEQGGKILLQINNTEFRISNTSQHPAIIEKELFQRFKTPGHGTPHSNGLGLAIVKRIVDTSGLAIYYRYEEGLHTFHLQQG